MAPLPARLAPQLATLVAAAPPGEWLVETKFDGYRLMARVDKRRGSPDHPRRPRLDRQDEALAQPVEALGLDSAWLDGEIVVMNDDGVPDFNALQNAIDTARSEDIEYFVFDLPFLGGRDLREVPLRARRALLRRSLPSSADATACA